LSRRGTILLAVLVIVTLASLGAATALLRSDAETTGASYSIQRDRTRSLARSGLAMVLSELAAQRDELLDGGTPDLTGSHTLYTDALGRKGVIRLVDLAPDDPGLVAVPEPSKLDLNAASAEMLGRLPGIEPLLADRIIEGRPFASVEELVRVEGVTPSMLYGPTDAAEESPSEQGDEGSGAAPDMSEGTSNGVEQAASALIDAPESRASDERLIDLLTVFSFDPNVQMGLETSSARGDLRINLNQPWSDRLERAVAQRFDRGAAEFLAGLLGSGVRFENDAAIVVQLRAFVSNQLDTWAEILDTFTTSDDEFRPGRVDINRASATVLVAALGVSRETADLMVLERESLDEARLRRVTWPVEQEVMGAEAFEQGIDVMTTRSLQWRVRIEVGELPAELAAQDTDSVDSDAPLEHAMVLDAVIDLASQRPRIAYLRDVTMLATARTLDAQAESIRDELSATSPIDDTGFDPLDLDTPMLGGPDPDRMALGTEPGDPGEESLMGDSSDIDGFAADDESGSGRAPVGSRRGLELGGRQRGAPDGDGASANTEDGEQPGDDTIEEPVDRRIGRWTTRQRGGGG